MYGCMWIRADVRPKKYRTQHTGFCGCASRDRSCQIHQSKGGCRSMHTHIHTRIHTHTHHRLTVSDPCTQTDTLLTHFVKRECIRMAEKEKVTWGFKLMFKPCRPHYPSQMWETSKGKLQVDFGPFQRRPPSVPIVAGQAGFWTKWLGQTKPPSICYKL